MIKTMRHIQARTLLKLLPFSVLSFVMFGCSDYRADSKIGHKADTSTDVSLLSEQETKVLLEDKAQVEDKAQGVGDIELSKELKVRTQTLQPRERQPLNLTLPQLSWQDMEVGKMDMNLLPNVFTDNVSVSAIGISGKLYWDESENADLMPLEDTLQGAEIKFSLPLP